jgi:glycosyltransferase involved in cell wall biosynthesis
LIIAENCNPEWTSVPLVGWSHYQALARVTDAHLVTQIRNRDALLRAGLTEGKDFTAIDTEKVAGPAHRLGEKLRGGAGKGWTTKMVFNLFGRTYFERLLKQRFGPRVRKGEFDIVHQLTPLSPTLPAKFATVCRNVGVPFVWGPINGGLPWPKGFGSAIHQEREWLSKLRGLYKVLPGYRATRRDASAILIGSSSTFSQMPAKYHEKCVYLPENAIDPKRFASKAEGLRMRDEAGDPSCLRICFLGRLVPYKGADMLLDACEPLLQEGKLILDLIGDGPQRGALEATIATRSIANVTLLGNIPHDKLASTLASYDVLGFPSIREFGGAVAIEAMALGVVPIVPNYGGLGELVSQATGYLVEMGTREQIVERFRSTLQTIVADPSVLAAKSVAAIDRVNRHFTWDAKAQVVLSVYDWLLKGKQKPQVRMPIGDE